jgi:branched-chain amino acid transport system ATP-binding protein
MELCDTLTVAENVALGRESSLAGANPISHVLARPRDHRLVDDVSLEAMDLCGITELAGLQAGALSTGQRRLVELARCLAGPFDVLLLDEPSSGLDREETARFADVLRQVVEQRGCGILLVEHDMSLVLGVCSFIYVMDFGRLVFEGTPDEVSSSPVVQAAYLDAPALELRSVESGYGETVVLRDIDLSVPASSVVGLLGPNGAGKSTLLKTVSGVVRPSQGSVWLHGADVTATRVHERARGGLCHIPEGRAIYRSLSVRENLVMQAPKGESAAAIETAGEVFPILRERLGQQAGTLSGGQQQMLAMAAAYVRNPRLVLVDEPSLGLAPIVVDTLFERLEALRERGVALLIVDQFVQRVLQLADHVYVLNQGRIDYSGTPDGLSSTEIFQRYLGGGAQLDASKRVSEP